MIIKTARLDYPEPEDNCEGGPQSAARRKWRSQQEGGVGECQDRLRPVLHKLAHRQLDAGDWKRLAHHWAFTEEQIRAIEHQYTGPNSYKEHSYRMLLIWSEGLNQEVNPVKSLCEGLCAINKKAVAESIRKKLNEDIELPQKSGHLCCTSCSMF
ncbi:ankyrin repeat and death domain-containing protein 1A-like [Homalodisca vitripennis]|nr:ankyrin repeat and death domain-containing protein 1A-like [Homalodisca vitripennis]